MRHSQIKRSALRSEAVTSSIVITWFEGYVTSAMAMDRLEEFTGLIADCARPVWIMELTAMTGFHPTAINAGGIWWREFKANGGEEILFISTQAAARMAGATLSASTGVKVRVFRSLDECYEGLGIIIPVRCPAAG